MVDFNVSGGGGCGGGAIFVADVAVVAEVVVGVGVVWDLLQSDSHHRCGHFRWQLVHFKPVHA